MKTNPFNMKSALALVVKACEPNSPSAAANWVKFNDGNLAAYGGTFCVQIPVSVDAECAFDPQPLIAFFRKDRTKTSYTVKDGRMLVKSKGERVTVKCLPGEEMPLIDVHRSPTEVKKFLPKKAIKAAIHCIDPGNPRSFFQGMCIRNGEAIATDGKILLVVTTNLDKSISCVVPIETLKFLSSVDEDVCAVACDTVGIKFWFPSGMTVCSRTILADKYPDCQHLVSIEGMKELHLNKEIQEEVKGLRCDNVEVSNHGVVYTTEDKNSVGRISLDNGSQEFRFGVNLKHFELLLSLTTNNVVHISEEGSRITLDGGTNFKLVISLIRPTIQSNKEEVSF